MRVGELALGVKSQNIRRDNFDAKPKILHMSGSSYVAIGANEWYITFLCWHLNIHNVTCVKLGTVIVLMRRGEVSR